MSDAREYDSNNNIRDGKGKKDLEFQKELQRLQENEGEQIGNLEIRLKELTEQNLILKEQAKEAQEWRRKYHEELLKDQEKFTEVESWSNQKETLTNSIIKKLQDEQAGLDEELQCMKKDLANVNLPNCGQTDSNEGEQQGQACQAILKSLQDENESIRNDLIAILRKLSILRAEWGREDLEKSGDKGQTLRSELCDEILSQLDELRNQLQFSHENCSGLENEVRIYSEKLKACNDELKVKTEELNHLKGNPELVYRRVLEKEEMLKESRTKTNDLEPKCQRLRKRVEELEEEVSGLRNARSCLSNDTVKSDIVAGPTAHLEKLSSEISQTHQQDEDLEAELSLLSRTLATAEGDLWRSQSEAGELTKQLKQSLERIAVLESSRSNGGLDEKSGGNTHLQQIKRQLQDTRFALQRKETESLNLETKLKQTREEMHKREIQMNLGEKQRSQLQGELDKERERVLTLENEHEAIKRDISEKRRNEALHKQEMERKDSVLAELKENGANMQSRYSEITQQKVEVEKLLEKYKNENKEIVDDLQRTQTDLTEMQVEFKVSENEKENVTAELQAAYERISALESRCQLVEQELKERDHEISLTTRRLSRMEAELEEASNTKSKLEFQIFKYNSNARKKEDEDSSIQNQIEENQVTCGRIRQEVSEKEFVIERLMNEISSLEADVKTLRTEVSYQESLNETNQEESKRLALKLEGSEEEVARLREQHESIVTEKRNLVIELSVAHKRVETMELSLKGNLEKENERVTTLQEERNKFVCKERDVAIQRSKISALELQSEALTKDKEDLHSKIDELEERNVALKGQLEEVVINRDQETRLRMELEEKNLDVLKDLEESIKTRTRREEKLQDLWNTVAKYEVQIEALRRQSEELKQNAVESNTQVINQREEMMKLEIVATEHRKMRESSQHTLKQKEKDFEEMYNVVKELQVELAKVKNELTTSKVSHECSLDEINRLVRKLQERDSRIDLLEKELTDTKEENRGLNVDLGCQTTKLSHIHHQLGTVMRENERLKDDFKTTENNIQKLQEDLLQAQNQILEKERAVESYRKEISEKDTYTEQLQINKDSLQEKMLLLKKELQTTSFYREKNESKVKEAQDEISALRLRVKQCDTTINTLLKERDENEKHQGDSDREKHLQILLQQSKERESGLKRVIEKNKPLMTKLEHDLRASRQECLGAQFANSKSQRLLKELKAAHGSCGKERKALRIEVLEVNRNVADLEVKYENEVRDNMALQSQLQDAVNRGETSRYEILKVSKQCVELKVLLEAANKEIAEKNARIDELKSTKVYLEEKSAELRANLTSIISECEKHRGEDQQLQDEILSQQKSICNLKDRLLKVQNSERETQKQLSLKKSEMESIRDELAESIRENGELKSREKEVKDSLAKLREENAMAKDEIVELREETDRFIKETANKESEITGLTHRNDSLTVELDEVKAILAGVKDELASAQESKERNELFAQQTCSPGVDSEESDNEELELLRESLKEAEGNLQRSIVSEDKLKREAGSLRENNSQLEYDLQTLKRNQALLEARCEETQKELKDTKLELLKAKEAIDKANDELEELQAKEIQFETQIDRMEAAKSLLKEELKSEKTKLGKTEDQLLDAQCKLQELQTKLDYNTKEAEGSASNSAKSEKKLLEKDIQALNEELSSAHALMNKTLKRNRELDEENFQLKKVTAEYETREGIFKEENEELNKSIVQSQKTITELELEAKQKQKANASLKDELEALRRNFAETKNEYDQILNELSQFRAGEKDFKKALSEKESLQHLKTTKRAFEKDLADLRRELSRGKNNEKSIQCEAEKLHVVIREKDIKISELECGILKVEEKNRKLQSDISELKRRANAQLIELQNVQKEIKKLNNEILSQNVVVSSLQARNRALEQEKQKLKEDFQALKWQLSDQKAQMDALQHENDRLQRKVCELQAPKSSARSLQVTRSRKVADPEPYHQRKMEELETAYQYSLLEAENAQSKVKSMQEEISGMEKENNYYFVAKETMEKEILWKNEQIQELQESLRKRDDAIEDDRRKLKDLSESKTEIAFELDTAQGTIIRLEECNRTYEEMITHLEEKLTEIQEDNSLLEKSRENAETKLDSKMQELLDALKRVSELETANRSNTCNNTELIQDLQASKNKIGLLEDELFAGNGELAQTSESLREIREQNDKLKKEVFQLKNKLIDEQHKHESEEKEIRKNNNLIKRLQTDNSELENEISSISKEMNIKATEYLSLLNKQEESQDEIKELRNQIEELESSWMQVKSDNEKFRLETSATRKLHDELKVLYDNLLDEVNEYRSSAGDSNFSKYSELQRITAEKQQLEGDVQLLNKKVAMLKENCDKAQQDKKEMEKNLKILQRQLFILESGAKSSDTIATLQKELDESKQKISDISTMYEVVRSERDTLRGELVKSPISPTFSVKLETRPSFGKFFPGPFSPTKTFDESFVRKEMFETQAKAMLLEQKLKIARERLEGLKSISPRKLSFGEKTQEVFDGEEASKEEFEEVNLTED